MSTDCFKCGYYHASESPCSSQSAPYIWEPPPYCPCGERTPPVVKGEVTVFTPSSTRHNKKAKPSAKIAKENRAKKAAKRSPFSRHEEVAVWRTHEQVDFFAMCMFWIWGDGYGCDEEPCMTCYACRKVEAPIWYTGLDELVMMPAH
jgi:hypothetical protein